MLSRMGVGMKGKVTRIITLNDGRRRTVVVPEDETMEVTWNRVTNEMGVDQPWVDPFKKQGPNRASGI
jgi:hypothetical protein